MRGYLKSLLQRRVPAPIRKWAQLVADRLPPSVRYGKPYGDALALLKRKRNLGRKDPCRLSGEASASPGQPLLCQYPVLQRSFSAKRPYSEGHSDRK